MIAKQPASKAIAIRDSSLESVTPALDLSKIPDPLPLNVTNIPKMVLSEEELRITSLDAEELLVLIHSKQLSCVTVTKAFLRRAALAQHLVNCVTELLPTQALERAAYLDSLDKPIGPLHGLPISVKEHHGMRCRVTNCGFTALVEEPLHNDSYVNQVIWKAGAVFYARTTQPQAMMHLETSSNVYGVTVNPYNLDLSPGGSSGGESALIGLRGSVLGIGGDSGGSIRVPAANTGIYGFKPTATRLSRAGTGGGFRVGEGVQGSHGPLSTSSAGLELFMSSYLSFEPWVIDSSLVPLPWRSIVLPRKLKVAVMWNDGIVKPHPPILRALRQVVAVLEQLKDDFCVVEWQAWNHDECWRLIHSLYYEDGGAALREAFKKGGEEALPLTNWLLESDNVKAYSPSELNKLREQRDSYRLGYNERWLATGAEDGHPVDAILSPVGPGAATPHGKAKYWNYTSQWNMLDYPAASFPVTTVDPLLDVKDEGYVPLNAQDQWNHDLYSPSVYTDAPVGLQLITRRFEDEKCLAVLKRIEQAIGQH